LKYVPKNKLTQEICYHAFKNNNSVIDSIPKKFITEKMCYELTHNSNIDKKLLNSSFVYIPDEYKTIHLYKKYLMNCGYFPLKNIPLDMRTKKICKIAIKNNGYNIEYINLSISHHIHAFVFFCVLNVQIQS
jgi:hypothetical protein